MGWAVAFGIAVTVLTALIGFLANWIHKVSDRVNAVDRNYSDLAKHIAEQYVRSPEIERIEHQVEALSNRLDGVAAEMRASLKDVEKALNQLIGQSAARKE